MTNNDDATPPQEIERRFLVAPPLPSVPSGRFIEQAYLTADECTIEVERAEGAWTERVTDPTGESIAFALPTDAGAQLAALLATGEAEVRVRRVGERFRQTAKGQRSEGLAGRAEVEFDLDRDTGARLFALGARHMVKKTRYRLDRWELDVFHGELAGLILLEIELASEDEPLPPLPEGLTVVREITAERTLDNAALARLTAEERRALVGRLYPATPPERSRTPGR